MKNIILISLLLLAGGLSPLLAQEVLPLETAIAEALQANYGIQVQRYEEQKSENSAYIGNAGLLPSISLSGNGQYSTNSASGEQLNPGTGGVVELDTTGISNSNVGAQAQLSYTLALANFRQYKVLQTSANLTQDQTRQVIENTALQVATAYYNLAKVAKRLQLLEEALQRSRDRLTRVQNQQEFGGANRLAVLNARVNINADSVNLVSSLLTFENARRDLNLLIGREIDSEYLVETDLTLADRLSYEELEQSLLSTNASLQVAQTNRQLAELSLSTTKARRLPTLSLNGTYAYNYTNNPFSIVPELQTWGPSVSASVNFNLYNGSQLTRQIQNAQIDVASSQTRLRETHQTALRDLAKTYANYRNNMEVLALNQMSMEAAQMNFDRTKEALDLGQATSLDFREAQLNLQQIENQLSDLRFDIKLNEIQLLQLSGLLIEQ